VVKLKLVQAVKHSVLEDLEDLVHLQVTQTQEHHPFPPGNKSLKNAGC
jgi:hypothetical protein